jgi:hypothetical protein
MRNLIMSAFLVVFFCVSGLQAQSTVSAWVHPARHTVALSEHAPSLSASDSIVKAAFCYDAVKPLSNGDFFVMKRETNDSNDVVLEKWGLVNSFGVVVVPPSLEEIHVVPCTSCPDSMLYQLLRVAAGQSACRTREGYANRDKVLLQPNYHHVELYNTPKGPVFEYEIALDSVYCAGADDEDYAYLQGADGWKSGPFTFCDVLSYGFHTTSLAGEGANDYLVSFDGVTTKVDSSNIYFDPTTRPGEYTVATRIDWDLPSREEYALIRLNNKGGYKVVTPWLYQIHSVPGNDEYYVVATHGGKCGVVNQKGKYLWSDTTREPWKFSYNKWGLTGYLTQDSQLVVRNINGVELLRTHGKTVVTHGNTFVLIDYVGTIATMYVVTDGVEVYSNVVLERQFPKVACDSISSNRYYETLDPYALHSKAGVRDYSGDTLVFRRYAYAGIAQKISKEGPWKLVAMAKGISLTPIGRDFVLNQDNTWLGDVTSFSVLSLDKLADEFDSSGSGYWNYDYKEKIFSSVNKFAYRPGSSEVLVGTLGCDKAMRSVDAGPGYTTFPTFGGGSYLLLDGAVVGDDFGYEKVYLKGNDSALIVESGNEVQPGEFSFWVLYFNKRLGIATGMESFSHYTEVDDGEMEPR